MKKNITALLLLVVSMMMPIKAFAMVEVDENGNATSKKPMGEEITSTTIMTTQAPDSGKEEIVINPTEENSVLATTSTDENEVRTLDSEEPKAEITTTGDAKLLATSANSNDNMLCIILISSVAGLALGSFGSYYVISHKRG